MSTNEKEIAQLKAHRDACSACKGSELCDIGNELYDAVEEFQDLRGCGQDTACIHASTRVETKTRTEARWVQSSDENYDENDPQESVTITDSMEICNDCGEVLDVSLGD